MPVEIRELVIRVSVNQPQQGGGEGSSQPAAGQPPAEKLVADAVEQVLDILNQKQER